MKRTLFLILATALLSLPTVAKTKRTLTEKDMGAYLFTFFSDPTHSLFMAISYDGYNFKAVNNGEPIIAGDSIAEQHGIRDPHIYRAPNGKFYIAMTDLHVFGRQKGIRTTQWERPDRYGWGNNRGLVLMASDDLIHWTHHVVRIDKLFPEQFGEIGCAWAPQTIWDPAAGKPMVYFTIRQEAGGRTKLYYSYADVDFTTLETEPQLLFEYPDDKIQVLDADICPMPDGRYFMTYVAQENPGGIKYMVSDRINHYDDYHAEQIDAERSGCEAPNVWKRIGEKKWVLMYDIYSVNPHNFGFVETSDFKTFTPLGRFNEGVMKLTIGQDGQHTADGANAPTKNFVSPKHGSVIHITKAEAKRLEQYWNEQQTKPKAIRSGELWRDDSGRHINAHGGGILKHGDTFYWFGEHKAEHTSEALVGVMCYASKDLVNWRNCGVALSVTDERGHDIERGCIMERPKVIYNPVTKKFCMWFHLELKGRGYNAARYGVAVADRPEGPYKFLYSQRANAGTWPMASPSPSCRVGGIFAASPNTATIGDQTSPPSERLREAWTPEWIEAVKQGLFLQRDFGTGQLARDMTLFVDDDGKAYHIFSSEDNLTLHIAELTADYLHHTGRYIRMAPAGHNEAPAIFKHDGTYWIITSGCTGWEPNEARMFSAPSIWGPWTQHPNPCRGPKAEITFGGQSTFILNLNDSEAKPDNSETNLKFQASNLKSQTSNPQFIFMADIWRPSHPIDARYIWLPIEFENGTPVVRWRDEWQLTPHSIVP